MNSSNCILPLKLLIGCFLVFVFFLLSTGRAMLKGIKFSLER